MSTTVINGLLTCKPKNAPTVGAIKAFVVENRGDWNKIRNPKKQDNEVGVNYRITKAEKTDYSDAHGNVSFNVELEKVFGSQHTDSQPQQNTPPASQDARGDVLDPILETRQHLMKACNLYNLCIDAVLKGICEHVPGEQMSDEQFQSTLASIWIEASSRRSTDGVSWWSYIDRMPTRPISKPQPKKEAQPNDDEEVPF